MVHGENKYKQQRKKVPFLRRQKKNYAIYDAKPLIDLNVPPNLAVFFSGLASLTFLPMFWVPPEDQKVSVYPFTLRFKFENIPLP